MLWLLFYLTAFQPCGLSYISFDRDAGLRARDSLLRASLMWETEDSAPGCLLNKAFLLPCTVQEYFMHSAYFYLGFSKMLLLQRSS